MPSHRWVVTATLALCILAVAEFTRELFEAAGIGAGDRVLDLGSGSGDVSFLVHELVAPPGVDDPGEVLGADLDPATGICWDSVSWISPVPGGMSTIR